MLVNDEVIEKIKDGAHLLCKAVQTTLGPNGANVILHNESGIPYATKDGVSVAKKVFSEDPYVNAVINIIRETAMKTAELAGDATTTTTILASHLIENGINSKANRAYISGMNLALKDIVQELKSRSTPVDYNSSKLQEVATISANNDIEIGNIVARAFRVAGDNGTVLFEESPTSQTYLEESAGTIIDRGYADSAFITNNKNLTAEYTNPTFLLVDDRLDKFNKIERILNICAKNNHDLVIFAHDYSSEVIRMLALNHYKGIIRVVPITIEGIGSGKGEFIQDIAALVNASKTDEGFYFGGKCDHIVVSGLQTIITVSQDNNTRFEKRLERIKALIDSATDESTKKFYCQKLAKLAGKLCTIKVGGFTPAERKERYDRVEDAVCATKAALEEGVVPGGGITLYRIADALFSNVKKVPSNDKQMLAGYNSVLASLNWPLAILAENAGMSSEDAARLLKACGENEGIDFISHNIVDMMQAGIIDSTKAMRVAVEHSVAVASLLLNTKCIIPYQ